MALKLSFFLAGGFIALVSTFVNLYNGYFRTKSGGFVARVQRPVQFWIGIFGGVAFAFLAFAIAAHEWLAGNK